VVVVVVAAAIVVYVVEVVFSLTPVSLDLYLLKLKLFMCGCLYYL